MKIGYVCLDTSHYSERFLWDEIRLLEQAGHEVTIFSKFHRLDTDLEVKARIVRAHRIQRIFSFKTIRFAVALLFNAFVPAVKLYRLERRHNSTVTSALKRVYYSSHILPYNLDQLVFTFAPIVENRLFVAKAMNTQMVVCLRGYDVKINADYLNQADKLFVRSNDLYHYALLHGLHPEMKYNVVPSAVDVNKIYFKPKVWQGDVLNILSIGRAHWKKGHEYTLLALHLLAKEGLDFRYTLVGSGAETPKLLFMVKMLGLENRVVFVGSLSHSHAVEQLYTSHVLIHSSLSEGCSNVLLEAQAAGVFCIASNIPGNQVIDKQTGLLYEKCNVTELVAAVNVFLQLDKEQRENMVHQARKRIEADFSMEVLSRHLIAFYK